MLLRTFEPIGQQGSCFGEFVGITAALSEDMACACISGLGDKHRTVLVGKQAASCINTVGQASCNHPSGGKVQVDAFTLCVFSMHAAKQEYATLDPAPLHASLKSALCCAQTAVHVCSCRGLRHNMVVAVLFATPRL